MKLERKSGTRLEEGPKSLVTEIRFISWVNVGILAPTSKSSISLNGVRPKNLECNKGQHMTLGYSQI